MDPSPQAGSSSVTVEYTDPSGLFPLVQPVLANKLPLKNLHWKSPTRPVRSIESLRIGFVPAQNEANERKSSGDSAVPHRRHQIPGLRQTPYLKIFLLRCDDNDTYKSTARKALREWIKSHASMSQSTTSQEKHDACEWLILHVVPDGDGAEKAIPSSKWGRATTTVLEKVKADFNGTSKSAVDRVAQLRLPKQGTTQKPPDLADQLEDLIEKIKNGILASFDLRVAQYEEDIKEKDSQRSLPGWNFCTFFILKEGLARGFENVGLFDDALLGYDELSIGLDTAIEEQLQGSGEPHGSTFLLHTEDWQKKAKAALESPASPTDEEDEEPTLIPELDADDFPIDSNKKAYREMILGSNISIFDFRIYIFSRQLTLLLRAAKAPSLLKKEPDTGQTRANTNKKPENLMLLSEICERATEFISFAARNLRYDLESGLADVDNAGKAQVINNLVSSWAYAAASQILSQTSTPTLTLPESSLHAITSPADTARESRPELPRRSSSLVSPPKTRPGRSNTDILSPDALSSVHSGLGQGIPKLALAPTPKTGSEQLSSARGELLLMARRVMEEIAGRCGWTEKWDDLGLLFDSDNAGNSDMTEVSLDAEISQPAEKPQTTHYLSGVELPQLKAALRSRKSFRSHFEELTDNMYRHHITANRTYSAQMALADMALVRFRQSDYGAAASYFHQITPFYGSKQWTILEGVMLEMYARCLKELQRSEEYVRMSLRLLAKFASHKQSSLSTRQKTLDASSIFTEEELVSQYVEELFEASGALQKDVTAPLTDFFADLHVKPAIIHYKDKDGFQLQLSLRFLLGKRIEVDSMKIRLVGTGGSQSNEHWLELSSKTTIKSSSTKILVDSSMTLQGKYYVDRVEVRAGSILFTSGSGKHSVLPIGFREAVDAAEDSRPYIYCYPPPKGLQAKIVSPHLVNLEEMRTLELELDSGWNDIKSATLRVRPATAGLRLRIAEAEVVEGDIKISANSETGHIEFSQLGPNSFVRFRIPYTMEEHHPTLSARAEVGYETTNGRFSYSSLHSIVSGLPISVNVQDTFKDQILFSRFTVSPAMMIPLRILKCSIPSSDVYQVQSNIDGSVAMNVFPKQPASLLYKIQQREEAVMSPGSRRSLRLSVDFTCVDDECLNAVERTFRESIATSEYQQYSTLLTSHIVDTFRTRLSTSDMEVIGLVREVETLPYSSVKWEMLLSALKEPLDGLKTWLQEWHQNHPIISLPEQPSIPRRHIIIPVDIPEIQVVHTAELRLCNLADQPPHAAVGQMIAAELSLRHTRRWCSPENRENAGGPLEFSYEIHSNPELWLVGGRRRGNFTADEGETKTFAVMLLPQKAGHLLLPGLEIKTFVPASSAAPPKPPAPATGPAGAVPVLQRRQIACEVDYRNHGETVLVLPDLRSTTVSLSLSGGNHGAAWLIDSERRVLA
ncbi:trafficking protein particle complex subunit 10 [Aspergillus pseudotamarii]|uniref:Trafficking protein particle complex subunit 10 n=1 Tax=Aspergillus pseudotamarii TaxID=132259 RepID=A0A5N6SKD7_ASPPS|nr:trafficking protein particle complex subunit 10 [Aspergillus pseudotamarii]KAE8135156.1 trafficking protein particle complex subunit 10 [Aspergillus pseudotamarii]